MKEEFPFTGKDREECVSHGNQFSQDQKQEVSEELRAAGAESEGVGKPAKE